MNRKELDRTFGMYKMEMAIEVMLQKSEESLVPFPELAVSYHDFQDGALTGFCHLLCRGMFMPGYPNIWFWVTQKLVEHMRKFPPWKDMADAPTFDWHAAKLFPKPP
jgi:hypothetical protein